MDKATQQPRISTQSRKKISEISIEILQILASCLLLHYTVFLKMEEILLKMQSSVSKGDVWVAMCALCFSF